MKKRMMKIAIIAAMDEEIAFLKDKIKNAYFLNENQDVLVGNLGGKNVALLRSGIGKVSSAVKTALLLRDFNADLVINTGSAGALSDKLEIGDIVISHQSVYHDVDLTAFNYQFGQMANCPAFFSSDKNYSNLARKCSTDLNLQSMIGLICSGDSFISNQVQLNKIKAHFPDAIAVEMESTAIAHVCHIFQKDFLILRAISDSANEDSPLNFNAFLSYASKNFSSLIEIFIEQLE